MRYTHRRRTEGLSIRSQYNWSGVVRESVAAVIMVTGEGSRARVAKDKLGNVDTSCFFT